MNMFSVTKETTVSVKSTFKGKHEPWYVKDFFFVILVQLFLFLHHVSYCEQDFFRSVQAVIFSDYEKGVKYLFCI